jgi:hypothetical protein
MKKSALVLLLVAMPEALRAAVPQVVNSATISATNGYTATGDGTVTVVTPVSFPVPTLSVIGLVALVALLGYYALYRVRKLRPTG